MDDAAVASAIHDGIVCRSGSISARDRDGPERLVRRAGSVPGRSLDSLEKAGDGRMPAKLTAMTNRPSRPLQAALTAPGGSFSQRAIRPHRKEEER